MNAGFALAEIGEAAQGAADHPVTFSNTLGLYRAPDEVVCARMGSMAARQNVAVLFVSSWGFEELCGRKFWRLLAQELSGHGLASLRFDYPGTGDALDPPDYGSGIDIWLDSIHAASRKLKELSGAQKIILVGHGIGGTLAWKAAETMEDVVGLALAAPALSGRNWLREFVAMSRIANQGATPQAGSGPAMGEQVIADTVATGLRAINISSSPTAPAPEIFLLRQQNRPADELFAQHLSTLETGLRIEIFTEYERFVRDVMFSIPPRQAIAALSDWARDVAFKHPVHDCSVRMSAGIPAAEPLRSDVFEETPVRFGDGKRLYGIVCKPLRPRRGATVLVASTGYDRMSGWGRITTQLCRELASNGIASMRFDMGNIADSPPAIGAPEQILYDECQSRDVRAAVDFLEKEKLFPVVISGRCSGGWAALRGTLGDPRVSGVVPVNVFDFYIPPGTNIEALLISSRQPLSSYGAKLMSGGFWKRVLRGEVRVKNGIASLWAMLMAKAISHTTPLMVRFPFLHKRFHTLSREFRQIAANNTKMTIVYSEGDVGAAMLETNFGPRGRLLTRRYGNPHIAFIEDADHNLTTAEARHAWSEEVKKIALEFSPDTA